MTIRAVVFDAYGTLYDVQSVFDVTERAFPGYGAVITQIWRIKQLEYTWLRSLMRRFEDFETVTRDALHYTLRGLGLPADPGLIAALMERYLHLDPYPDAAAMLATLTTKRAILSNGSTGMLAALTVNSGLAPLLDAVISVDDVGVFKPDPAVYELIEQRLAVRPNEVLFVSSNPWDICGAKAFGLNVAWIERVTPEQMALSFRDTSQLAPLTMFNALRLQMDELGVTADHRIAALSELPSLLA